MHQTSLITDIRLRNITNWQHFCHRENQNNTSSQFHSLYAQLKTAETITNKTAKILTLGGFICTFSLYCDLVSSGISSQSAK